MTPLELGLGLRGERSGADYRRLGRLAERSGFANVSAFGDLMAQPPLYPLLEIAAVTERVGLAAACLNPFTTHPVEIAGQVAALDAASGGRASLGLARGAWLDSLGVDQPRPLTAIREAVEIVRRLLRGDRSGYEGELFSLAPGLGLRYEPFRAEVPLLIGGWGERVAAYAGEQADELKLGGSANPEMVRLIRDRLRPGAERAGRDPDEIGVVVGAVTVVDEDGRAARRRAAGEAAMYLEVVGELDPTVETPPDLLAAVRRHLRHGDHEAAGRLIPLDLLERFAIAGTPEEVAVHVESLFAAGARRVEFGPPQGLTSEGGVELLASHVLPRFAPEATLSAGPTRPHAKYPTAFEGGTA